MLAPMESPDPAPDETAPQPPDDRREAGDEAESQQLARLLESRIETELDAVAFRRDRLLAALALMFGAALVLAVPFALRAGAEFFLPVTAALVIAIALVPLLEWMERRRVPSALAAFLCVVLFLTMANVAVAAIVLPAAEWFQMLPDRIGQVRSTLAPLVDVYSNLEQFIDNVVREFGRSPLGATSAQAVRVETPNSLLQIVASSAPYAAIQMFFAVLVIFFFLSGWTRMRKRTIMTRTSFDGAMTTARVIQQVVDATSTYLGTITVVNIGMGLIVALVLHLLDMPTPLMWGGIVAVLNYIPYLGPIASTVLLALGGLMAFEEPLYALLPALTFVVIHMIEANIVTPMVVGRRLTINPLMILISLSFWAWVWGTTGALLAVPLLIIFRTILDAAGKPDIAGFLFEEGTLIHEHHDDQRGQPPPG